jgi:uncharacterized protein (TIGR02453 family)
VTSAQAPDALPRCRTPPTAFQRFDPSLFEFLEQLAEHNNRHWFQANKGRYDSEVFEPATAFIRAFAPRLKEISPYFVAGDRRVGGSLMRVYRDTRFFGGEPYKTNVGIQFRHQQGRDIHAPGFYVHIAPDECFLAVGMWRPDADSLRRIRLAIVERPRRWQQARDDKTFRRRFDLEGGALRRPPRGFAADHPHIEDLKRTDFLGLQGLDEQDVLAPSFLRRVAASFAAARPFVRFLCDALKIPY